MAVTEQQRHNLHNHLERILGSEDAAVLMKHLPPGGYEAVATKHDIAAVLRAIEDLRREFEQRFAAQDEKFEQRFAAQDKMFEQRFGAQDEKFEQRFAAQDEKFEQRFGAQERWIEQRFEAQDHKIEGRIERSQRELSVRLVMVMVALLTMQTAVLGLLRAG